MFIKDGIIDLMPVYPYQIDYLNQDLSVLATNPRAFICKNNGHYENISINGCRYVSNYISSQQHPLLKDFVPRKYHVVEQAEEPDTSVFFNLTYFDRVCHLIMVPTAGSLTYAYTGIETPFTLEVGRAYAVNNRAPRAVTSITPNFRCFISLWIDFDLAYYLKEYDGNSKCERKKDEYFS
jgi:hypothetical protein